MAPGFLAYETAARPGVPPLQPVRGVKTAAAQVLAGGQLPARETLLTRPAAREYALRVSKQDILTGVSNVLEHFIRRSDTMLPSMILPTAFDGPSLDQLSVQGYLAHIMQSGLCSNESFVIALVYGERLLQRHPTFVISRANVHRLLLVTTLVASKILDDFYCRNTYYAQAGNITKKELNDMEISLCFMLDFDLNVSVEEFAVYCRSLARQEEPCTSGGSISTSTASGHHHVPDLDAMSMPSTSPLSGSETSEALNLSLSPVYHTPLSALSFGSPMAPLLPPSSLEYDSSESLYLPYGLPPPPPPPQFMHTNEHGFQHPHFAPQHSQQTALPMYYYPPGHPRTRRHYIRNEHEACQDHARRQLQLQHVEFLASVAAPPAAMRQDYTLLPGTVHGPPRFDARPDYLPKFSAGSASVLAPFGNQMRQPPHFYPAEYQGGGGGGGISNVSPAVMYPAAWFGNPPLPPYFAGPNLSMAPLAFMPPALHLQADCSLAWYHLPQPQIV